MREALAATLRFVFGQEVNLHRLQASVLPENSASLRVLRASGFEDIGMARNYLRVGGKWRDHLLTQCINPDWREPHATSRVT
jgi:ribosomal-protein-alanine N-acetyltransferase